MYLADHMSLPSMCLRYKKNEMKFREESKWHLNQHFLWRLTEKQKTKKENIYLLFFILTLGETLSELQNAFATSGGMSSETP